MARLDEQDGVRSDLDARMGADGAAQKADILSVIGDTEVNAVNFTSQKNKRPAA